MTEETTEKTQAKLTRELMAMSPDEFLTKAYRSPLSWQATMVALGLWAHRDEPVDGIIKALEDDQIPVEGSLRALGELFEQKLWMVHPALMAAQAGMTVLHMSIDDAAVLVQELLSKPEFVN